MKYLMLVVLILLLTAIVTATIDTEMSESPATVPASGPIYATKPSFIEVSPPSDMPTQEPPAVPTPIVEDVQQAAEDKWNNYIVIDDIVDQIVHEIDIALLTVHPEDLNVGAR